MIFLREYLPAGYTAQYTHVAVFSYTLCGDASQRTHVLKSILCFRASVNACTQLKLKFVWVFVVCFVVLKIKPST